MITAYLAALAVFRQTSISIPRDSYGVPHISASSSDEAFFMAGYAVAQDRLWQMELSRRLARGRMAEIFGAASAPSDREILQFGYTAEELQAQLDHLAPQNRAIFRKYSEGVNAWIEEARKRGLPPGYDKYGFKPEPWTVLDSAAISIRLLQQFGRGGAGEIRNLAVLSYLGTQPKAKDHVLDVFDDFAWFNDPKSIPTVLPADDRIVNRPNFDLPDRKTTEKHLAQIPKLGLLELLQGVRVASREASTKLAEKSALPYKTGSYCVVVTSAKSATGWPLLLSGPQMGFRSPSIVHEMSIAAPGLSTAGMDVPGVPGVLVGETPDIAWGLTSGVADTDDIFLYPLAGDNQYGFGSELHPLIKIDRVLHIKGAPDQTVVQYRTGDGPVVLRSSGAKTIFAKKTSYWMHELDSLQATTQLWQAKTAEEANRAMGTATMSFNFFFVTRTGDAGYRYVGRVPVRAPGIDPRFPTPAKPEFAWRGFIPMDQMPHGVNPSQGFFANWNNKPAAWWPNGDTPAWGQIFRNEQVLNNLQKPKLNIQDLELVAWNIARTEETWPYFKPFVDRVMGQLTPAELESIQGFDGRLLDGSRQAITYLLFIDALRTELLSPVAGNFASPDNFRQIGQPSVLLRALKGQAKTNFLGGRRVDDVVLAALRKAVSIDPTRVYHPSGIVVNEQPPIPYSNRGTYIQLIEALASGMSGRNVVPPGIAETGPHSQDQVPLSRAWVYKPMVLGSIK